MMSSKEGLSVRQSINQSINQSVNQASNHNNMKLVKVTQKY